MRERHFTRIAGDVRVDFRLITEKGKVLYFAINVSLCTDKPIDIYRADTAHGYLHEQRFWLSPKPRKLDLPNYNVAFVKLRNEVLENFPQWVMLFEEKKKKKGEKNG